ncbi:MAG: DegT/DnrJ/EryC1/StrS family aminotransferase [Aquihabitans sp.]
MPIIKPDVSFAEVADDIEAILDSGMLTSGSYVAAFEEALASAVGVAHAVTTTSATTALHLALVAQGISAGDEVLVSDFTFPASGNVIAEIGAIPILVDSAVDSFALDMADASAKVTSRTKAIMPVHPFGQPADIGAVTALATDANLVVVEDAACALGSGVDGRSCGSVHPSAFSFHPRKVVTSGEGGAITTNDDDLADRLRMLRTHGGRRAEVGLEFVENGFNYRLSEIPAALGLAQLRRLDDILGDRARTAESYNQRLASVEGISLRVPGAGQNWSYQSYVVMVDDGVDRNQVIARMRELGIETTLGTYAMHAHPAFAKFGYQRGDLPNSLRAQEQSLTLPLLPHMDPGDVDRVVETLTSVIEEARSHDRSHKR